jgi:ABC-type dipeptide/oligopeptide/nickel transport system permease subunit
MGFLRLFIGMLYVCVPALFIGLILGLLFGSTVGWIACIAMSGFSIDVLFFPSRH